MRSVVAAAMLVVVAASQFAFAQNAAMFRDHMLFTAFVHGNETEFENRWNSSLNLNYTRIKVTSFETYMGPFGLHMGTAKFYVDGDGVRCDRNETLAPSENRSWFDPCVTRDEFDMSLLGWREIEGLLLEMEPMYLFRHLAISELWSNFTEAAGPPSSTKWKWRLHADRIGEIEEPHVGRVELQPGEGAMWGTVCFEAIPFELAVAICNNIFPGTTSAKSYRAAGGRGFIAAFDINNRRGIVNASLGSQTQKNNLCTHRDDLGLICGPNVTRAAYPFPEREPALFHLTHGEMIDWKIEAATVGAIPPGSILRLEHFMLNMTQGQHNMTPQHNLTFLLFGDAGFTSRDLDWIVQHTNPWVLNDSMISHLSSTVPTEPRFFEHPSNIGKAKFEVALHVFEMELRFELDRVLVRDSVLFVFCQNDSHTSTATGATVHTCWVDFENAVEAAKAVEAANLSELRDVASGTDVTPSNNNAAPSPSSSGVSSGAVAAIVICVLVVVGGVAAAGVIVMRRRAALAASARSVSQNDIDENLMSVQDDQKVLSGEV